MDRKNRRGLVITGLCVIAIIGTTATPASASGGAFFETPGPYSFQDSFPECDDQVQIEVEGHGVNGAKNVPGSNGQAFLATQTYHANETWTDNEGNFLMSFKQSGSFRETSATLIDPPPTGTDFNDDPIVGPVYEFTARDLINLVVTLADGSVYRGVGRVDSTMVFDTKGDFQPGGVPISYEEEVRWSRITIPDVDFCDLALSQAP
jgi:hypothetical protein